MADYYAHDCIKSTWYFLWSGTYGWKYGVQKTGSGLFFVIQKEKRQSGLFSFWITMTLVFCTLLFSKSKVPDFFQGHKPTLVFKTRIVGADWLEDYVVNPPERKLAKRTSVYWCYLSIPLFPFEKTSKEKFKPSCFIPFIFNKGKKNNEFTVNCETKSVFEGLWLCLSSFFVKCQFIQGQRREKKGVDF